MTGAAISFERRWTKGDEPKTFVAESKPWLGGEGKREFSSGDRWNLLLPAMLCTSLCPETVVVALPTGRKGLEKEKRKREREKRGSGSIDEIARISTLSPSPSFNSWPSLQMLVSRAHTGKGFLPSSLFFLLLSLSFSPLVEIFSLSLSLCAWSWRGSHWNFSFARFVKGEERESKEQSFSSCLDILFGKVDRVGFWTSCFWPGFSFFFLREEEWRRFWGSWKFARLGWKKLR